MLDGSPYQGYLYAYPHKTAYRGLEPRPHLRDVWAGEDTTNLFLYLHLPFCEMRCGFCNLFTRSNPPAEQVSAYLAQLRRQATTVVSCLDQGYEFARAAIGGGTPTYLTAAELDELFTITREVLRLDPARADLSVETSPATATPDRLEVLLANGTHRISMGVQSFLDAEAHAAGRPQKRAEVDAALSAIRAAAPAVLNLDLIYGIDGQTAATWATSLRTAVSWSPEEIFLYPLYVRPLTGLEKRSTKADWDAHRLSLYRQGRDTLLAEGYRQLSMRHFRRTPDEDAGEYCCQDDGMVGLGCGARSYTTGLHYSFDYAVSVREVRGIIDDYLSRPAGDFAYAEVGFALDEAEQKRRWLIKSLLKHPGLSIVEYRARFHSEPVADFSELEVLAERNWILISDDQIALTDDGMAHSDTIGPWLASAPVQAAMTGYTPR